MFGDGDEATCFGPVALGKSLRRLRIIAELMRMVSASLS
jgi:hypothetical protein